MNILLFFGIYPKLWGRVSDRRTPASESESPNSIQFPMPVEMLEGWLEQTVQQVKKMGFALARHTGQEESVAIRHLAQRLSVLLAKGNAALILNRVPTFPPSSIDGMVCSSVAD